MYIFIYAHIYIFFFSSEHTSKKVHAVKTEQCNVVKARLWRAIISNIYIYIYIISFLTLDTLSWAGAPCDSSRKSKTTISHVLFRPRRFAEELFSFLLLKFKIQTSAAGSGRYLNLELRSRPSFNNYPNSSFKIWPRQRPIFYCC